MWVRSKEEHENGRASSNHFLAVLKVFCMGGFALVILLCIFGVLESFLFGPGSHQNSAMAVNRDADDSGVSATRIILDAD